MRPAIWRVISFSTFWNSLLATDKHMAKGNRPNSRETADPFIDHLSANSSRHQMIPSRMQKRLEQTWPRRPKRKDLEGMLFDYVQSIVCKTSIHRAAGHRIYSCPFGIEFRAICAQGPPVAKIQDRHTAGSKNPGNFSNRIFGLGNGIKSGKAIRHSEFSSSERQRLRVACHESNISDSHFRFARCGGFYVATREVQANATFDRRRQGEKALAHRATKVKNRTTTVVTGDNSQLFQQEALNIFLRVRLNDETNTGYGVRPNIACLIILAHLTILV